MRGRYKREEKKEEKEQNMKNRWVWRKRSHTKSKEEYLREMKLTKIGKLMEYLACWEQCTLER